jgi:cysteine synthase A
MGTLNGLRATIGNTPLIRLGALSEATGCEIYGKAEFMNPGGSVKDRAALGIIEAAERDGRLKPGGVIVEGTAGNTGIGLAVVAHTRGYATKIVIPNTQAREKMDLLRAIGAEVIPVPVAPYSDPGNYNHVAKRLAAETKGGFWADQFDNLANQEQHYRTTGPEIWAQTGGRVTAFVSAVGTGGTLAGTSRFLKEKDKAVKIVCADPYGTVIHCHIKTGQLEFDDGDSVTEGIGQGRITKNFAAAVVDECFKVTDPVMMEMLEHLLRVEGLFLGSSAALNVVGAVQQALEGGRGQTIVTVLCDGGGRYLSKIWNHEWRLAANLVPDGLDTMAWVERIARTPRHEHVPPA